MAERLSYTTYYEPPRRTATIQRLEDQVRRLEARLDRERLRNKRLRERLVRNETRAATCPTCGAQTANLYRDCFKGDNDRPASAYRCQRCGAWFPSEAA
jgi:DNA-directed RNA polymerase subunit M/transcription elongation factor TFIIS